MTVVLLRIGLLAAFFLPIVAAQAQQMWPQPNWCDGALLLKEAKKRGEVVNPTDFIRAGDPCAIRNNDAGLALTPQIQRDLQQRR
jgi:hypothetical protein